MKFLTLLAVAFTAIGICDSYGKTESNFAATNKYLPGIGARKGILSIGRYGFNKGDGLLDCSYTSYGWIEKVHVTKHPLNKRKMSWGVRFNPPNAKNPREIPYSKWAERIKDDVKVNWISTEWISNFTSTANWMGRKKNDKFFHKVTYSIVMPGFLLESNDKAVRFDLRETRRYQTLELPLGGKSIKRGITKSNSLLYSFARDGALSENWILLRNSHDFPDVPLLLVLKDNPDKITAEWRFKKLVAITLKYKKSVGYVIISTPCGIRYFSPGDNEKQEIREELLKKARFWSKALLAYIVNCEEYFKIDETKGNISIQQKFKYRILKNVWKTKALKIAPLPPALMLANLHCDKISTSQKIKDLDFPTKYGPLHAVLNSDTSEYILPLPPVFVPISIPEKNSRFRKNIAKNFPIRRHDGTKPLPASLFPGFWSRPDRAIVDAGSMLGDWIWLWPYLSKTSLKNMRRNAREYLIDCLDDRKLFKRTELFKAIQRMPQDMRKITRPLWFARKEPFSKRKYMLSYTIPNIRKKGENITSYKWTFTDLEWGNGFALYNFYHLARVSDSWDLIAKHWELIKDIHVLFELLQDWACMSASGSEGGRRWTDTSCFPSYGAYCVMAYKLGKKKEYSRAVYLYAKHAAMRMAMFNAGTWVNKYHKSKPWLVVNTFIERTKGFKELYEPHRNGVKSYPDNFLKFSEDGIVVQKDCFYSLVAEGVGYECPDMFYSLMPKYTHEFLKRYLQLYPSWKTSAFCKSLNQHHFPSGGISTFEILMFMLRDPNFKTAQIRAEFKSVKQDNLIKQYLKGFYGHWNMSQELIEAMLETRDNPCSILDWKNCKINSCSYVEKTNTVQFSIVAKGICEIRLKGSFPKSVHLNGKIIPENKIKSISPLNNSFLIDLPGGGILKLRY